MSPGWNVLSPLESCLITSGTGSWRKPSRSGGASASMRPPFSAATGSSSANALDAMHLFVSAASQLPSAKIPRSSAVSSADRSFRWSTSHSTRRGSPPAARQGSSPCFCSSLNLLSDR